MNINDYRCTTAVVTKLQIPIRISGVMEHLVMKNVCGICGRGFNRIEKLNMHKNTVHESKGTRCTVPDIHNVMSDSDCDNDINARKSTGEDSVPENENNPECHSEELEGENISAETADSGRVQSEECDAVSVSDRLGKNAIEQACLLRVQETKVTSELEGCTSSSGDACHASCVVDTKGHDENFDLNCSEISGDLNCSEISGVKSGETVGIKEKIQQDIVSLIEVKKRNKTLSKLSSEMQGEEPGWLVALKEKKEKAQGDRGREIKNHKTTEAQVKEPGWLVALKEKTEKEQRDGEDGTKLCNESSIVNNSKVIAIEPACLIEVSEVALSLRVADVAPLSSPIAEAKPKSATALPLQTTDSTSCRRDARLRKIIRPVKKLSYNEAYSDGQGDSDEKEVSGNSASASKAYKAKSNKNKNRNHTPVQKDVKCPMCPEIFRDIRGVKSHILVHLNDDTQICEVCQEEVPERQELILHLRGHVQVTYKCERCPSEFTKIGSFYHHRDKHLVEEDGYVYTCNICGKTLYNKWYLKEHKRKHNKKTTYICEVCGKMFSTKATLKAHLEAHTAVKHTCELCGKNYARRVGLLNHLRRDHEGIKKHECPDCGKKFFARKTLVQHTRIHTGEKPYACDFCGKTFTQKINRDQHRRLHTGEQPYRCEYCFKCFSLRAAYTQHLRTHTGFKVSEMNPSILQPSQTVIVEENSDVENTAALAPYDLSLHSTAHVN